MRVANEFTKSKEHITFTFPTFGIAFEHLNKIREYYNFSSFSQAVNFVIVEHKRLLTNFEKKYEEYKDKKNDSILG